MERNANHGPPEVEQAVDLSGEAPAESSYHQPLDQVSISGNVSLTGAGFNSVFRTSGALHRSVEFFVVGGVSLGFFAAAGLLCYLKDVSTGATLVFSAAAGSVALTVGVCLLVRRTPPTQPTPPTRSESAP
jgi:hypothetical protein